MINQDRLVTSFCALAAIDSPSSDEKEVADFLMEKLKRLGLTVQQDSYGNIIATDEGDSPILLSAHMDTVEPGRGIKPIVDSERIYTDGTTILGGDCKAGISIILEAIESLADEGLERRSIEIVLSREEELGLLGCKELDFSLLKAKEAIVFDGEGRVNQITSGSPTYLAFDIDIKGRAAHAGVEPEKGISAIKIAAEIIVQLQLGRLDDQTTMNIGSITGGSVRNAVPENASLSGEIRSHDEEGLDKVKSYLLNILQDTRNRYSDAVITEKFNTEFQAYKIDPQEPVVKDVIDQLIRSKMDPELILSGGGTDANVFRSNGINAVVLGVADHGAHTVREHIIISELVEAASFCRDLLAINHKI
jgi:tripeptide aminopeptidase